MGVHGEVFVEKAEVVFDNNVECECLIHLLGV